MEIFIYDSDNKEKIRMPVIPKSIAISSPQKTERFETVVNGEFNFAGQLAGRKFQLTAFFPVKDYPFVKDATLKGMKYVDKIQEWRNTKKPVHIYITDLEVGFKAIIPSMQYSIKDGSGDIYFEMSIEEYNFNPVLSKNKNELPSTAKEQIKVTKDGYVKADDKVRNNIRTGPGIGFSLATISSTVSKLRSLRQYGDWIQVQGGWLHKKFIIK